jgi:predicted DNA-binding transcriptional regulator AlpA
MPGDIMQKVDDIEKKFLTRDEAALFIGLRPQTLANLTWQNAGPPYVRLSSRCLRYDRAELLAWMKAREVRPGEQES